MQLLSAFTEPGKLFADLKQAPRFALPFWLMLAATAAVLYIYYLRVDFSWMVDSLLSAQNLKPAEQAAARASMNPDMMRWSSAIMAPISIAIVFAITGLYYLLAGKISGAQYSYRAWFAFGVWASVPLLLSTVVALLNVLTMAAQTAPESIYLTHLHPMLFQLPSGHPWLGLCSSVDLISLWAIALAAIGWRSWTGNGWPVAVLVAALPSVLIYGIWALFIVSLH